MTLKNLKGVGPKRLATLKDNGIETLNALVNTFPKRYDLRNIVQFDTLSVGETGYLKGTLASEPKVYFIRKNLSRLTFKATIDGRLFSVTLFNQHYLSKVLFKGSEVVIYAKKEPNKISMTAQKVLLYKSFEEGIVPLYGVSGLSDKIFSDLVEQAYHRLSKQFFKEWLLAELLTLRVLPEKKRAYREVHNPTVRSALEKALKRFRYKSFLTYQLKVLAARERRKQMSGAKKIVSDQRMHALKDRLSFELSPSQEKALEEIRQDMASFQPMRRMLQGDTGSGKTVVALLSALAAIDSGFQVAFMVPTEILASQQFRSALTLFEPMNLSVGLFTQTHQDERVLEKLSTGALDLIIGTHKLFARDVNYDNLGLVITDEQHRFGVNQRRNLSDKGVVPDILYLSATPIPRTLAQTLFGDMDISVIERPETYLSNLQTAVRTLKSEENAFKAIERRLASKEQVYIVAPTIEDTDTLIGVNSLCKRIKKRFEIYSVAPLHGKMKGDAKERNLNAFKAGTIDILVTTTVIEVGIHIENATLMVVYHAERFGYAQLHQLRGRVGRGNKQGACLFMAKENDDRLERLKIFESTQDGFELSEIDLNRRGFGDIIGTKQSGLSALNLGKGNEDRVLFKETYEDAHKVLKMAKDNQCEKASKLIDILNENNDAVFD